MIDPAHLPPGIISARASFTAMASDRPKKKGKKQPPQATQLVDLAHELYDIVQDQHGQVVAVSKQPPRLALPLRGKGNALTNKLKLAFYKRKGTPPSATAITGAIDVIESMAMDGERVPVHVRCARTDDGLVIDLGDPEGRAIVVRDGGWQIMKAPPSSVVFRRSAMTAAMPRPSKRGNLNALREFINVTDEGWDLVRAWLVLAWTPHVPVPILSVTGEQGAGKSYLGRKLVSVVDPSAAPLRSMVKDLKDWHTTVRGSRVVGLDNISRINEDMSDAFCRAATGDGAAKRQLYTDEDLVVQSFRSALLLTSIDPGALRGDLAERLMPVELVRPTKEGRRGEEELDGAFARKLPTILGGLLDLVAEVLANPVKLKRPSRMADAANVIAAVDQALGSSALPAYERGQAGIAETVLESDPLASALLEFMDGRREWVGEPTRLFREVMFHWDDEARNRPANAKSMSERLKRMAPVLLEARGIVYESRRGDRRVIELRRREEQPDARRVVKRRRARE